MSNYAHNIAQPEHEYDRQPKRSMAVVCLNLKLRVEGAGVMEV
jgi:hypothetical protein